MVRQIVIALFLSAAAAGFSLPAASLAAPAVSDGLKKQIDLIDQEILLLRAELAESNGDRQAVQRYLQELEGMSLSAGFAERFRALKARSRKAAESREAEESDPLQKPVFRLPSESGQVVVVLPLSGEYAVAGEKILAGLREHWRLSSPFVVLDSAVYDNMFELWELVKLYSPDLVIGPLSKQNVMQWQSLKTSVPTLYLNQPEVLFSYEKALSPDKEAGLLQLEQFVDAYGFDHLLVISEDTESAENLVQQFQKNWTRKHPYGLFEWYPLSGSVDLTVRQALRIQRSAGRRHWLEKNIERKVVFEPRARQDTQAIIHLLPLDEAVQVKPLLDFFHLNSTLSLWYPSRLPERSDLHASLPFWQHTYAFLPPYLVQSVPMTNQNNQFGPLYALGELAAKMVTRTGSFQPGQLMGSSPLGRVVHDKAGRLHILPVVYWLDDGQLQTVPDYYFQLDE